MLNHILLQAQNYERNHGIAPNVVYINPTHYAALAREYPALFEPGQTIRPGFRMVIVPACRLAHPGAARVERPPRDAGSDTVMPRRVVA